MSSPGRFGQIAGATWWSILEIATRYGTQFLVMVGLARLLTPEDFGLIAILAVFTALGTLLVDSGFGTAIIRLQNPTADDETTVFVFSVGVGVILGGLLVAAAPLISTYFSNESLQPLAWLMSTILPIAAISVVPDALLTMRLNFRTRAQVELFASVISGATALLLALTNHGVWSLAWLVVIAAASRCLALWLLTGWRPRGRFNWTAFRKLFGFGSYMLLANLINTVYERLQAVVIAKLSGHHALGLFTVAQNTQQAPTIMAAQLLNRIGLPVFSSVAESPLILKSTLRRAQSVSTFIFMPCISLAALYANEITVTVYGTDWIGAGTLLRVLLVGATVWPLHVLNLAALAALGRSDLLLRLEIFKKIIAITAVLVASHWGALGVAFAVSGISLAGVVFNAHYSQRLINYGVGPQLRDQAFTIGLTILSLCFAWWVSHNFATPGLGVVCGVLTSLLVYLGIAFVGRHPALREILLLANQARSPSSHVSQ